MVDECAGPVGLEANDFVHTGALLRGRRHDESSRGVTLDGSHAAVDLPGPEAGEIVHQPGVSNHDGVEIATSNLTRPSLLVSAASLGGQAGDGKIVCRHG